MLNRRSNLVLEQLENRLLMASDISIIRHFDTWDGVIPSSDPAGIVYDPDSETLLIADSEINEIPEFIGNNVFETNLQGDQLVRAMPIADNNAANLNKEPTGITYLNGYFYVTNDDYRTITRYDSNFDQVLLQVETIALADRAQDALGNDPEGITADTQNGLLYVSDGGFGSRSVMIYNENLEYQGSFSVADRLLDAEGIAFHQPSGHLFVLDGSQNKVFEYTTGGQFIEEYNITGTDVVSHAAQGITFGPTSDPDDGDALALYIADGRVDNFPDGRIFEATVNFPGGTDGGGDNGDGGGGDDGGNGAEPEIISATITPNIAEINQHHVVRAQFEFEPGDGDHTARIYWGDGTSSVAQVTEADGSDSGTFYAMHRYQYERLSGDFKEYEIEAVIVDADGDEEEESLAITIHKMGPQIDAGLESDAIYEGDTAHIATHYADYVSEGRHDVDVDWGDGSESDHVHTRGRTGTHAFSHTYLDDNPTGTPADAYTITARVANYHDESAETLRQLVVLNADPVFGQVTLNDNQQAEIIEGDSVKVWGDFTDKGVLDTHVVSIDWGDGSQITWAELNQGEGYGQFELEHRYLDNPAGQPWGQYHVTITAYDDDGGSAVHVSTVTVHNVAPYARLDGPSQAVPGQWLDFHVSGYDNSPIDQELLGYSINWGDGAVEYVAASADGAGLQHTFAHPGTYQLAVVATDKDGATGPEAYLDVHVSTVAEIDGNLLVGGTSDRDVINFLKISDHELKVVVNGHIYGPFAMPNSVVAYGQAGNDLIFLTPTLDVSAMLFGGEGNDVLRGAKAGDLLHGGAGRDILIGFGGDDILVGGSGTDYLFGYSGNDILIGGETAHGHDAPRLRQILADWNAHDDIYARSERLYYGGALNHETVLDDYQVDYLFGGQDSDWLFDSPLDRLFDVDDSDLVT